MRYLRILALAATAFVVCAGVGAQKLDPLIVDLANIPNGLIVLRNEPIRFVATVAEDSLHGRLILETRAGVELGANIDDEKHVALTWTPPRDHSFYPAVLSWVERDGTTRRLKRIDVNVVDSAPAALAANLVSVPESDTLQLRLTQSSANAPAKIDLLIDGGSAPDSFAWDPTSATASIDISGTAAGTHIVRANVTLQDGAQFQTLASAFVVPSVVSIGHPGPPIARIDPTNSADVPTIEVIAAIAQGVSGTLEFAVDDKTYRATGAEFRFNPANCAAGDHKIVAQLTVDGKVRYRSSPLVFTMLPNRLEVIKASVRHYNLLSANASYLYSIRDYDNSHDAVRRARLVLDSIVNDPLFQSHFRLISGSGSESGLKQIVEIGSATDK